MALPETIPVKYTEEEAESLSVRPVVRQAFRLEELIDMVVTVTGKDPARIQTVLRAGTVVFHFYRYWWTGFEAAPAELSSLLARFPDPDPGRRFVPADCVAVLFTSGEDPPRHVTEIPRPVAQRRRLLRRRSFWDALMDFAAANPPAYLTYSYARAADLFRLPFSPEHAAAVARDVARFAPRSLRRRLGRLADAARLIFVSPRPHE